MRRQKFGNTYFTGGLSRYAQHYLQTIVATLVAICLILVGLYQINSPNTHTQNVKFTVSNVHSRQTYRPDGSITYNSTVVGNVDGCNGPITINSYPYNVRIGQVLTDIYMRPECKGTDAVQSPLDNTTSGGICIGIGIIILIFSVPRYFNLSRF